MRFGWCSDSVVQLCWPLVAEVKVRGRIRVAEHSPSFLIRAVVNLPKTSVDRATLTLVCLVFVSGFCALVYQVVWMRELRLIFGATTTASASVLAIFMGGLGCGSVIVGRWIDRSTRPLWCYALLELGIAISVGTSPWLIDCVRHVYLEMGGVESMGQAGSMIFRIVGATVVLGVPTAFMGGTLPVAARVLSAAADEHRSGVGWLYGLNTLGAVCGAAATTFYLLEQLGNRQSLWLACVLNVILALVAYRVSQRSFVPSTSIKLGERDRHRGESTLSEPHHDLAGISSDQWMVYLASAVVGFVFFMMELVWYRMLGPLLGGTTYTFGLILCVALAGIGIGGAVYAVCGRYIKPGLAALAVTCVLEAAFMAVPYWIGDGVAMFVLDQQIMGVESFAGQIVDWAIVASFVVFPPALVAGFQFPLLIAIAGSGGTQIGRHVGWTSAANMIGAIVGALAGGFVLLPWLTAPGVWRWAVYALLSVSSLQLVLLQRRRRNVVVRWLGGVTIAVIAIMTYMSIGPTAVWRHSGIGAGRALVLGDSLNDRQDFKNQRRRQCIWEAEGIETSIAITATDGIAFIVNGKSDGNAFGDVGTQVGVGVIGAVLHRDPKECLVVGLGTGETAGWLADVSATEVVDVVELEPAILEMAQLCDAINQRALQNEKIHLHFNDAREYLLTTSKQYDVIVSEPSNPYRVGVANLFTREFYLSASKKLRSDGLFVQWMQSYEIDERTVEIVLQTVRSVFPHFQVWRSRTQDLVLVCSHSPLGMEPSREFLEARLAEPAIQLGLQRALQIADVEGLLAHFVCDQGVVDSLYPVNQSLWNSDDCNLLEYAFAKTVGKKLTLDLTTLIDHIPEGRDAPVWPYTLGDKEKIRQRRLAMEMYLGGVMRLPADANELLRSRRDTYQHYAEEDYRTVVELMTKLPCDIECPVESLVYAHALAEMGQEIPPPIADALRRWHPTDGIALEVIREGVGDGMGLDIDASLRVFEEMRTKPWGTPQVLNSYMKILLERAEGNRPLGEKLYAMLETPLSVYRLEDRRLLTRLVLAEGLGPDTFVEALGALEPHVPFKQWLLISRFDAYRSQGNPLAQRAVKDLDQFMQTLTQESRK